LPPPSSFPAPARVTAPSPPPSRLSVRRFSLSSLLDGFPDFVPSQPPSPSSPRPPAVDTSRRSTSLPLPTPSTTVPSSPTARPSSLPLPSPPLRRPSTSPRASRASPTSPSPPAPLPSTTRTPSLSALSVRRFSSLLPRLYLLLTRLSLHSPRLSVLLLLCCWTPSLAPLFRFFSTFPRLIFRYPPRRSVTPFFITAPLSPSSRRLFT
jgi:hypothetical protein